MSYLIDTNVISELIKPKPENHVLDWFSHVNPEAVFLSVITMGEIRKGIENISDKNRKAKIVFWLEQDLINMFRERILAINSEVADRWGRLQYAAKRTLPAIDSLIAATALHYDLALVTRNVADFNDCPGLQVINPWDFK